MSDIRYLMDENVPHAVRDGLLLREPGMDVICVGDEGAPGIGTLDEDILVWLEQNGYVLVSRNRRTMPNHLQEHLNAGHYIPGILLVRRRQPMANVIEDLLFIWRVVVPDEFRNRVVYIPL